MIKQPMLAADLKGDTSKLKYPLLASPKIDGIRAVILGRRAYSRSMKLIPNEFVQNFFATHVMGGDMDGWDGELVVGSPTAKDCMQATTSGVMSKSGEPNFSFFVFDDLYLPIRFRGRNELACEAAADLLDHRIVPHWHRDIADEASLLEYERECLVLGYEGLILRDPSGPYKQGRSTLKEGYMLKLKRFTDGEAVVIGVEELMRNQNEQTRNETGHAQRSSAKAGLVPGGVLGALRVRDCVSGVEFSIGSGFAAEQRAQLWEQSKWSAETPVGRIAKYKSFKIGEKDAPRFPVFQGFRDPRDM